MAPEVIFATEGPRTELSTILAKPEVIPDLKELHAAIALAITELSPERARLDQFPFLADERKEHTTVLERKHYSLATPFYVWTYECLYDTICS